MSEQSIGNLGDSDQTVRQLPPEVQAQIDAIDGAWDMLEISTAAVRAADPNDLDARHKAFTDYFADFAAKEDAVGSSLSRIMRDEFTIE